MTTSSSMDRKTEGTPRPIPGMAETFESLDKRPRATPIHTTDYPGAFMNPERVITVRVRGHLSDDGYGIGGRLVSVIDENGNPYNIVGLDPGTVYDCPGCQRRVYVPDAAQAEHIDALRCPFRDCAAQIPTAPRFGGERIEDKPAEWRGGVCSEHGEACPR